MSPSAEQRVATQVELVPRGRGDDSLVDLLDRIIDKGVVIKGDVVLAVAGVDLIHLGLQLSLTGIDDAPDW